MMEIQHKSVHYKSLKLARRITERIWLRAFGTSPKFLASLGTSDTLETLGRSSAIKDVADTSALVSLALKER